MDKFRETFSRILQEPIAPRAAGKSAVSLSSIRPYSFKFMETVDSTNRLAHDLAEAGAPEGLVVIADAQTAGRGRMQRSWNSPPGTNLYFSMILRPQLPPPRAAQMSLVSGVALQSAVKKVCPELHTLLKWPNDLLSHEQRKLAGVLCEASAAMEKIHFLIIGIGINVNQQEFPPEIADIATSLSKELRSEVCRERLLAVFIREFDDCYETWLHEGFAPISAAWNRVSALYGRHVAVSTPGGMMAGKAVGIDEDGALLLQHKGQTLTVNCGDVTLREWS